MRSGRPSSYGVDTFQKRFKAPTYSELQSDPANKVSAFRTTRKCSPESGDSAECEDPFLCPPRASMQQWRLQLRSSSHDVPMPDYTSNKTDNSAGCTEMSEVSFPRVNFLKHMHQANPAEIVQALSPARQEELLKALSVSKSPARGTLPPTNTPCSTSEDNRVQSSADQVCGTLRSQTQTKKSEPGDKFRDGAWISIVHEPERKLRQFSEVSSDERSEEAHESVSAGMSPKVSSIPSIRPGGYSLAPPGGRSTSLNTNRQRSVSNPTKRKHGSLSPLVGSGRAKEIIPVVIDSPFTSSEEGSTTGSKHGTLMGNGTPLLVE